MLWRLIVIGAACAVIPHVALAEASNACERLAELDEDYLSFDDQEYHAKIDYSENNKLVKNFNLRIVTKGTHKTLVSFVAPGARFLTSLFLAGRIPADNRLAQPGLDPFFCLFREGA